MYLMDYDSINQLLVCMVCGEQQYTFSADAVRAHIQETHPSTLCLEDMERQSIQHAWDQQVAMRERFFTNQLWQNNDAPNDQSLKHTAEIEVILEADDKSK
ncbi:spindlin interactor and repressor of chromatin-binding protein [Trichomycterus rosablanca]|uniref:spindlin interactor and repressor of chromatin-binding protein n=1 Tax=Trichomycterus rosablanca TaxID=2290929 RepID=UPI002F356A7B